MVFRRKVSQRFLDWKNSEFRKPLVVFGARQVGKTHAIKQFGESQFSKLAMVDFSRDTNAAALFSSSLSPKEIVSNLELFLRMEIDPENTLIFFDEVQLCERALTSLKYFCEDAPEYHVIAAGSLLGVQINREKDSFPVGKVDMIHMNPFDFEEFLWALNEHNLTEAIRAAYEKKTESFFMHDHAMELLRSYEIVGGMPEVVSMFVHHNASGNKAFEEARVKQNEIRVAYAADMVKYASTVEAPRILAAWNSAPRQLAKENKKFQYKMIQSGARSKQYSSAIDWLVAAGVVLRCTKVSEPVAPLKTFEDEASFKLYLGDVGLLSSAYEALPGDLEPSDDKASNFRGALAENYVFQQLNSAGVPAYYWGTASKAEVEFIIRMNAGEVVPVEVKSGVNVRSTSLNNFVRAYSPEYAVRLSAKNFGYKNGIRSIPLYAAWLLAEEACGL